MLANLAVNNGILFSASQFISLNWTLNENHMAHPKIDSTPQGRRKKAIFPSKQCPLKIPFSRNNKIDRSRFTTVREFGAGGGVLHHLAIVWRILSVHFQAFHTAVHTGLVVFPGGDAWFRGEGEIQTNLAVQAPSLLCVVTDEPQGSVEN